MSEFRNKTFKGYISDIGLYGIAQLLLPLTQLVALLLVTKLMGVSDYGIYALTITTAGILLLFVSLAFPSALIRFLPGEKDRRVISTTFISALSVTLLAGAIIVLFMLLFADILATRIFHDINARIYLYIIAVKLIFDAWHNTLFCYFRILEQVKRYLKYYLLFNLINIGLIAAAVFWKGDLLYVFLALLLSSMMTSALLSVIFLREQGWAKPDFKKIKPYFAFCLPLLIPQIMYWIITLSDRYFIAYFWGAKEAGIYNAAYNLPLIIASVNGAIWFVLMPVVARLWNTGEYEKVRRYFTWSVKLFVLLSIPATFGLIILGTPLLTIISTAEIGQEGWKVIPFVSLSHICYVVYGYGADVFLLQRRTRLIAYLMTTAAVVNVAGNFLLVPSYGILGAAITTLIAYALLAFISVGIIRRVFPFPVQWSFIAKTLLASLVMSAFLWFFHPQAIWEVMLAICLGAVIYFVVLFAVRGFNRDDIRSAKDFL